MERSYSGMNAEYYVGMETCFYPLPEGHSPPAFKRGYEVGGESPTSGSSSNTATHMEDDLQEPGVQPTHATLFGLLPCAMDCPLPIRKRQRKPIKKSKPADVETTIVPAPKKPGRKPKAAGLDAACGGVNSSKGLESKSSAREPLSPRELPVRHTPKKFWEEDDIVVSIRRGRTAKQNTADLEDYSPTANARRPRNADAPRQPRVNSPANPPGSPAGSPRPYGGPKGQKEGGPCAVCFATKSATWRRGAQGGRHSGEPLCNKCGVWEFRHPDSPPRDEALDLDRTGFGRRGSTGSATTRRKCSTSRGPLHQPLNVDEDIASLDQPFPQPTRAFPSQPPLAKAESNQPSADGQPEPFAQLQSPFSSAATAALQPPSQKLASGMQHWEGNNLVARIPDSFQLGTMQRWAAGPSLLRTSTSGPAAVFAAQEAEGRSQAAGSKKRNADSSSAEPVAKRWQNAAGSTLSSRHMWAIADAAKLSGGGKSSQELRKEDIDMAEGLMGLQSQQTKIKLRVKRPATGQMAKSMEYS